ncbi:hypothetical protein AWU82_05850 [Pseudomonas glycinae]|uniref:Uncharacterized protein n=1 Tax=Pseudomonas glycinae TaxID=1785145 RepID=A0ABN4MST5_9PSED|nr:hypothetical protein AWU82_05850 [Pseudomonas glycinae]
MVYVLVSEESVSDRKTAIFWRDRPVTRLVRQIEPATAANGGANQFLDSVPDCPDVAVMTGNLFICISIQIKVARMPESGHPVRLFGQ